MCSLANCWILAHRVPTHLADGGMKAVSRRLLEGWSGAWPAGETWRVFQADPKVALTCAGAVGWGELAALAVFHRPTHRLGCSCPAPLIRAFRYNTLRQTDGQARSLRWGPLPAFQHDATFPLGPSLANRYAGTPRFATQGIPLCRKV